MALHNERMHTIVNDRHGSNSVSIQQRRLRTRLRLGCTHQAPPSETRFVNPSLDAVTE